MAIGVFILGVPLLAVLLINLRLAVQLSKTPLAGDALVKRLMRTRLWTQVIAAISLFVTSVFGMAFSIAAMNFF